MEHFVERFGNHIKGMLSGFDRVLFRGIQQSICYVGGMERFLSSQRVLLKDFGDFAAGISERVKAQAENWAKEQGRPFHYLESSRESKENRARQILQSDPVAKGLVCILSCVEPCQAFAIFGDRTSGRLRLVKRQRKCLHLYFYLLDREFGLFHVRLQTWFPFTIQVCINGRQYLAEKMKRAGIGFCQHKNCFTALDDFQQAAALLHRLESRNWAPFLQNLARQVNPLVTGSQPLLRDYYWTARQSEYAVDVVFNSAKQLQQIYPALLRHAIEAFSSEDILRFLQRHHVQGQGDVHSDLQRKADGIRVKHWVQENSIKMYDKAGCVLRIELTINNPRRFSVRRPGPHGRLRQYPLRAGLIDLRQRVQIGIQACGDYLQALALVADTRPCHQLLDGVSQPVVVQQRRYRALRPVSPEDSQILQVLLSGTSRLQGVRNRDLRRQLYPNSWQDPQQRVKASARITRQIRLLIAHGLLFKISGTNRYSLTNRGNEVATAAHLLRQADFTQLAA
ncbi:MAG: hypothetical protein ACR2L2_00665 [Acidobacteriota bacterium]